MFYISSVDELMLGLCVLMLVRCACMCVEELMLARCVDELMLARCVDELLLVCYGEELMCCVDELMLGVVLTSNFNDLWKKKK